MEVCSMCPLWVLWFKNTIYMRMLWMVRSTCSLSSSNLWCLLTLLSRHFLWYGWILLHWWRRVNLCPSTGVTMYVQVLGLPWIFGTACTYIIMPSWRVIVSHLANIYVHPPGGWIYYFCFFRRPMSDVRCPMSGVRRPASDVRRHAWFPLI